MNRRTTYKKIGSMAALVALLFTSCYEIIPVEKSLLSEEELIPILKDIHIAEALLTETVDRRKKDSLARFYYGQIFELHQVDSATFNKSMHAYFTDPPALDSLYQEVIDAIGEEKKTLLGDKKAPKREK
ncbi:MAG: Unknown protein [uncultured Aureispira sp.]|uniref:DUF4296 domain-containing protein n=1 Tax=uncultured Aureispira sp. TaxID=1331704 RepID=A0A6S6RX81_9BACT|nr:MAG: Unknown protein [uncultured Aureispira sp.]